MNNLNKNIENQDMQFSSEQLEILKDEYSKKLVNEELKDLEDSDNIYHYRKKHCVSERDTIDMIVRNEGSW